MILTTRIPHLFGASAITVWPFILVYPNEATPALLKHENVHYDEQRRWACFAGVGLLVWWALYLLCLPALWNPLRRGTETRAYKAQGLPDSQIRETLRHRPYFLWA